MQKNKKVELKTAKLFGFKLNKDHKQLELSSAVTPKIGGGKADNAIPSQPLDKA